MTMSVEAESYSLSDPMTVPKLERTYDEVVLKQDFYAILLAVNGLLNPTKTWQRCDLGQYLFSRSRNGRPSGPGNRLGLSQLPAGKLEL